MFERRVSLAILFVKFEEYLYSLPINFLKVKAKCVFVTSIQ